ncbi:unnamed protein product [Amoebophrya sp. A25]|nr:unnamed protein product [Amoebophrya sp. A25]|eukprot:GSA25T00021171001.1
MRRILLLVALSAVGSSANFFSNLFSVHPRHDTGSAAEETLFSLIRPNEDEITKAKPVVVFPEADMELLDKSSTNSRSASSRTLVAVPPTAAPQEDQILRTSSSDLPSSTTSSIRNLDSSNRAYTYRTYQQILDFFGALEKKHPTFVETFDALERYPHVADRASWAKCGTSVCKVLVVRLADEGTLTSETPELFYSGELHGNERIGPQVLVEMAHELTEAAARAKNNATGGSQVRDQELLYLLQNRAIYLIAMSNPHGYFYNRREERGMDPNRDFPYLQKSCMKTVTARVINELFREHLFRAMITFHGGTRILSYEWGSRNHAKRGGGGSNLWGQNEHSTEAPDNNAQVAVASAMQLAAGKQNGKFFYPKGTMTDTIYWVDGGLEDWSYAASWEGSPNPINTCRTHTYKSYPESRTKYNNGPDVRTVVYLVETDDLKTPPQDRLGSTSQLWQSPDVNSDSHVPRNLRMSLKLLELIEPAIRLSADGKSLHGVGCLQIEAGARLVKLDAKAEVCKSVGVLSRTARRSEEAEVTRSSSSKSTGGSTMSLSKMWKNRELLADYKNKQPAGDLIQEEIYTWEAGVPCRGLDLWARSSGEQTAFDKAKLDVPEKVQKRIQEEASCLAVLASFDSAWAKQSRPDPAVPPQTHMVRSRVEESYKTHVDGERGSKSVIDTTKIKAFRVSKMGGNAPSTGTAATATEGQGDKQGSPSSASTQATTAPTTPPNTASTIPVVPAGSSAAAVAGKSNSPEEITHRGKLGLPVKPITATALANRSEIDRGFFSKTKSAPSPSIKNPSKTESKLAKKQKRRSQKAAEQTVFLLCLIAIILLVCNLHVASKRFCCQSSRDLLLQENLEKRFALPSLEEDFVPLSPGTRSTRTIVGRDDIGGRGGHSSSSISKIIDAAGRGGTSPRLGGTRGTTSSTRGEREGGPLGGLDDMQQKHTTSSLSSSHQYPPPSSSSRGSPGGPPSREHSGIHLDIEDSDFTISEDAFSASGGVVSASSSKERPPDDMLKTGTDFQVRS